LARWLVTGGCGFIGAHLVAALLRRGDDVRVIDDLSSGTRDAVPDRVEVMVGDVVDRILLRRAFAGVQGCFHLAAIASVPGCDGDWAKGLHSNVCATIAVFEAARDAGAGAPLPVVYASSAAVYGDNSSVPLAETAVTAPSSSYGAHKLLCELYARSAWARDGLPTVGLRLFNVYGPGQDPNSPYSGVISIFVDRLAVGAEIAIHGDGQQVRDFVYVGDAARHLLAAMACAGTGAKVLNVCTGRATSVLDLARLIARLYGRAPAIRHQPPRAADIRISLGDPGAAIAQLGIAATTRLEDGLRCIIGGGGSSGGGSSGAAR
jgi:UDP-glucose 4-epimerase